MKVHGIVVGKRVTVGAAITSTAVALGSIWPEHSQAFSALSVPITFAVQVWIANALGVTNP